MATPPAEDANARRSARVQIESSPNTHTQEPTSQLREEQEYLDTLQAESEQETENFEIAREIAEMRADELSRSSRSCLRETPLMHFWQRRRKALQS